MSRFITIKKAIFGCAICAFLLLANTFATAASTEDVAAFGDNYPTLSTEALLRLVVKGDELAQHEWGTRLALGSNGVPANRSAAAMWYSRAAQRGTPGSASLSTLPNAPLRVDRTAVASGATLPPEAQLADPTETAYDLARNIDGSGSNSSQTITHYVWDAWSDALPDADVTITDLGSGQAQILFPTHGTWLVTLIVLDASGRIDHHTQTHTILEPLPDVPALSTPSTDEIIQSSTDVGFSWLLSDTAESYDFEIFTKGENPEDPSMVIASQTVDPANCSATGCALAAAINAATGDEIFWRVQASNAGGSSEWAESRILIVALATSTPADPGIVSPSDNADLNSGVVTEFVWLHEEQVETYEFFFFNNDPDGDVSPIVTGLRAFDLCDAGECRYETSVEVPIFDRHTWRVRAVNSLGNSQWTQTYFNAVDPVYEAPEAPVLASPQNETLIETAQNIQFTWDKVATASAYELQIVDTSNPELDAPNAFIRDSNCGAASCTTTITMDLPLGDTYQWLVRATNAAGGSPFASRDFSIIQAATEPPADIIALTPLSLAELVIGSDTTFQWQRDDTAVSYDFYLYNSQTGTFTATLTDLLASNICADGVCSVMQTINVDVGAYHQWRVRGENSQGFSGLSQSFFTAIEPHTEAPTSFALLAPATAESLVQNESATFTWAPAERAESYEISLPASDGSSTVTAVLSNNCDAAQCSYSTTIDLPIADGYEWQVSAINSVGQTLSDISTFTVVLEIIVPPEAPVLVSPAAAASFDVYSAINFEWQVVADATSYEFYITDGNDGAQAVQAGLLPADICSTDSCSLSINHDLSVSDSHSWHVRAKRGDIDSDWSERAFAVNAPTAPVLLLPLATTEFESEDTVVFQWSAVDAATTYDFFITDSNSGVLPTLADLAIADYCVAETCSVSIDLELSVSDSHTWQVRAKRQDIASEWTERTLVIVPPTEPVALFSMLGFDDASATRTGPLTIIFDPSESSDDDGIVTYQWDFGDGSATVTSSTDETQTHTYDTVGEYTAKLIVTDTANLTNEKTAAITVLNAGTPATDFEAARLLTQASFGPSRSSIEQLKSMGVENWLDWQLSLKGAAHLDYVQIHSNGSGRGPRHEIWWADVVEGDDQLRQRIAFALSQILVVADTGFTLSNAQYAVTNYYDILRNHSFGNFRDLLEEVTLSPVMGLYLSMLQNAKGQDDGSTRADENYAREILQLFSIGLHNLNVDGTTDGSPSFNQDQIEAFARVFTGWNYADAGNWDRALDTGADMINQMLPFEEYHDTDAKTLLNGLVAPAGNTARQDLELALDNIFNHANVGPFISKQLIKRLVTSNPSPAYVGRVAQVFNNNGDGVRGDLGAVVKAILLDTEARTIPTDVQYYGKLREPVLRLSHLWRAFNIQRGQSNTARDEFNTVSPQLDTLESVTGQAVLRSPSVFNFFLPSYSPAGPVADGNLDAPEFELFTEGNELATSNRIGRQIQNEYAGNPISNGQATSYLDYTYEVTIADDSTALVEHLDVLLLSGNMSDGLKSILKSHIDALPATDVGLSQRVRDSITLIMASPDYLVQM